MVRVDIITVAGEPTRLTRHVRHREEHRPTLHVAAPSKRLHQDAQGLYDPDQRTVLLVALSLGRITVHVSSIVQPWL